MNHSETLWLAKMASARGAQVLRYAGQHPEFQEALHGLPGAMGAAASGPGKGSGSEAIRSVIAKLLRFSRGADRFNQSIRGIGSAAKAVRPPL